MPLARASELDRLLACPGSLVLPRADNRSERAKEAAEWGTAVHYWKETGKFGEGRLWTSVKKKVAEVDRGELWPEGLHEVPLAYNVLSGEARALVLPVSASSRDEWKQSFNSEWIVGTADFVGLLFGQPWVDDLKTGRAAEWAHYQHQQTFYLMTWILFSEHALRPGRSTITHWPRYPITIKPMRYGEALEVDYFRDFQTRLRGLHQDWAKLKTVKESGMDVSPRLINGPQCVYCPSKLDCTKGKDYDRY